MMASKKEIHIRKTVSISLTGLDILSLVEIPSEAKEQRVEFTVPSGGDYSGMKLPISSEGPIKISYVLESLEVE